MWTCPKCGEEIEEQFDSCWKCAGKPETVELPKGAGRRWWVAFGLGMLLELGIGGLLLLLPRESWLFARVLTFLEYTHFLFLRMLDGIEGGVSALIALTLIVLIMAVIWAFVLLGAQTALAFAVQRLGISSRHKRLLGGSAVVLCIMALGAAVVDSLGDKPVPFTPSRTVNTAVADGNALALELYKSFAQPGSNLFFSPFGIYTGLGLLYAGTHGVTETEMRRAGHFTLGQGELHSAMGELMARLNQLQHGRRLTLVTLNGLWCQQGQTFSNAFLERAQKYYHAELRTADFKRAGANATTEIDEWLERRTHGKITTLVKPRQLDWYSRLVFCSALYFKGNWRSQFNVKDTQPKPFQVSTNEIVAVPMMHQSGQFRAVWIQEPGVALLELPYYGGDLAMIILLPEAIDGLTDIEKALDSQTLNTWLARMDETNPDRTSVRLPHFRFSQSFDLIPTLCSLGMVSAFAADKADFSRIDGTTNLFLSAALQQTFVEVNESGTEATSATLFEAKTASMAGRFYADHPFLFLIRDRGSKSILFLGRIVNPSS